MTRTPATRNRPIGTLGPVADLESHLPAEWWRELFDSVYLQTDGDVVENAVNTRHEVDTLLQAASLAPTDRILDLCCGQGRHVMELASRGFGHVVGVDRSRYLIRLARRRGRSQGLPVTFHDGDARRFRVEEGGFDAVIMMGNSFGYFSSPKDDVKVLERVKRALRSGGTFALDITDGDWMRTHYERRTWEWVDQQHFVCRERSLSGDGDRLISREVVVHSERGVIADQFYAERLYSRQRIVELLESLGFQTVRVHQSIEAQSDRGQDLGMMANRLFITATAPRRPVRPAAAGRPPLAVTVVMGDPRMPDTVKLGGQFNAEDFATVRRLKDALAELPGYSFSYLDNHATLDTDLRASRADLVFNLCDEGFDNDALKELHVPALLEMIGIPYTGAGPASLAACYDKALVRAVAAALDIPVPLETFVRADDQSATIPGSFPAILKPNQGDSSIGITANAVVSTPQELVNYLTSMRNTLGARPVLVQEYLTGAEYSVGLLGNPGQELIPLPLLEVDFSGLDPALPRILGYVSKWDPKSPYWNDIRYKEADIDPAVARSMIEYSTLLFERLACHDYARFDFRADSDGNVKLLEVNPNPGWCWDGKFNLMAGFGGMSYSGLLQRILESASQRLSTETPDARQAARTAT
ncbi:MAG: methyltransferase domain-containing protein [Alphaproteobacteria bacterium]